LVRARGACAVVCVEKSARVVEQCGAALSEDVSWRGGVRSRPRGVRGAAITAPGCDVGERRAMVVGGVFAVAAGGGGGDGGRAMGRAASGCGRLGWAAATGGVDGGARRGVR
jgi:hypothetical protein